MSEERRKLNKHCTGTVPKVKYTTKYRNNTGQQNPYIDSESLRDLPNNLSLSWPTRRSDSNFQRDSQLTNFEVMDGSLEEVHQNGIYGNGTATSSQTSSSNSRRNSCTTVPKCDNVTKYPNKRQIEDKLNQIKEYLHITSSLMSSMKNGDEQITDENEKDNLRSMIEDLRDSEAKLNKLLKSDIGEENSECGNPVYTNGKNDFDVLTTNRDSQNTTFQHLKQRGDSRLRDARQLQERLAQAHSSNSNRSENNLQEYDLAIAELVESTKRLNEDAKGDVNNFQQQEARFINAEIEELQNQIQVMHSANEDRNKLIELLDKRDAELRCQHLELQNKLVELQSKKSQVDYLVAALQTDPRPDDDVGAHVQRIVLMKDQLAKLKDMLELVENTEEVMQNGTQEEQAIACEIYNKAENFLNKDIEKVNCTNQSHVENPITLQYENRASSSSINLDKHMNKKSRETRSQCNDSKISEKLALQAELKAKKRELEEIMGKHKASSSNLNHDVGTDNKSDLSCSNSIFDNVSGVWAPLLPSQHNQDSSDRYSSDEGTEDANEYSEIPSNQRKQSVLPPSNGKYSSERNNSSDFLNAQQYERVCQPFFRSPESNNRLNGTETNLSFSRDSSVSTHGPIGKQNVQKQLELIRSVCDSMLPQQQASHSNNCNNQHQNVQNLRNNLTPSPVYSELRPFTSPNVPAHNMNALNVIDNAWYSQPNLPLPADVNNYQNWLTTNTLQTQAFMLNSLNQCCQMLWLQQRELTSLRNTVAALQQERLPSPHYNNNEDQMTSPLGQNLNCSQVESLQAPIMNSCVPTMNQCRTTATDAKLNVVTSACSLPNLNQYNTPPVTVDPIFANHNNLRLMDSVNNVEHVRNMVGLQGTNDTHIWNRQALNNQVAPGNRANNYWDNFRSYSRQNLFSTKSNDGFQNSPPVIDRTNNTIPRSVPFEIHSMAKSNSQHVTQENVPQRSCVKPSRRYTNTNIAVVPPDVLNINHNIKNEGSILSSQNEDSSNNVTRTPRGQSNNVTSNESNNASSKNKLFEELRENVYQEVASLISANEARPHFLIQLFRDLQLISSDPLRLKTLQSIQVLISESLRHSQSSNLQDTASNQEIPSSSNEFSLQSTVWSPIPPNSVPRNATILEGLISKKGDASIDQNESTFHEIVPFLNDNEHVTLNRHLILSLKQKILETKSFKRAVKDTIFQKHFANVLDDVLNFYNEKPLCTVKNSLLQSVRDLLERELSFMNLIQSTGDSQLNDLVSSTHQNLLELRCQLPLLKSGQVETAPAIQIQNEDLAEADQSHVEDDDVEEEGAVGGFQEPPSDQNVIESIQNEQVELLSSSVEGFAAEAESQYQLGLDQVPTRLPIKSKSRSNTPNKDKSMKHDGDHHDRLN